MEISLKNKSILVTGGTGGLGSVLVEKLIQEKAKVFFTYHKNEIQAEKLVNKGAIGFKHDLMDRGSTQALKENIKKHVSSLDGLVNNAAAIFDKTISKLPVDKWDEVIQADLTSIFLTMKTLLPLLYKAEKAKIVNLTSRVGVVGGFGQANYAAAKAGVIALTKTLAKEAGRKGICVNAVNPGFMITGMNRDLPKDILESKLKESVLGSYSDPDRVADFILYLLSNRADTVSGQVFHIDSRNV